MGSRLSIDIWLTCEVVCSLETIQVPNAVVTGTWLSWSCQGGPSAAKPNVALCRKMHALTVPDRFPISPPPNFPWLPAKVRY